MYSYRGKGIGKWLFALCAERAQQFGARKIYLRAGSGENTIALYGKMGCVPAAEPDRKLIEEDPRDIQLEFRKKLLPGEKLAKIGSEEPIID